MEISEIKKNYNKISLQWPTFFSSRFQQKSKYLLHLYILFVGIWKKGFSEFNIIIAFMF